MAGSYMVPLEVEDSACSDPPIRREWRSLGAAEKQAYISAVKCLSDKPSKFDNSTSRFDDFALAHISEGLDIHYAAAFLPWHRHFIHTFEEALRAECLYSGSLPYWDWSLDAADLAQSPIWSTSGFGSDGTSTGERGVGNGHCVTDGPFANSTRNWQAEEIGSQFKISRNPHCLSRGFQTGDAKKKLQARVTPESIISILEQDSYAEFFKKLEDHAHNAIPQFIRGDFLLQTAPNDPVFYLHHAQVDRLWWLWQRRNNGSRMWQYHGPISNVRLDETNQNNSASLEDVISLGKFGKTVAVGDVINTHAVNLCYSY
ncbi:putative domain, di-copper centre [Metarhizium robertsii ARSEF 23]|nr:putative domain, di-copper centre [Metarhizium robertsii ARSEF 23]EFY95267.2 putative domain, di-copper centre [Metarhizium robertsii ARSEF 23]